MTRTLRQEAEVDLGPALWSFFEGAEVPAALCDADLTVLAANAAFADRVGTRPAEALAGLALPALLRPDDGPLEVVRGQSVRLPGGAPAVLHVVASGALRVVTLEAVASSARAQEAQLKVSAVGRLLSLLVDADDLVGAVAQALGEIFEGRSFAVRVVDPTSHRLEQFYAVGELRPDAREVLTLQAAAAAKMRLPDQVLRSERVRVQTDYHPIFRDTDVGIGVPLVAGDQLFGMLNVEARPGAPIDPDSDERLLIGLANQLSVALHNARLLGEARYLRGYLENLIDHANALVAVIDRQGRIAVFNRACERLSGWSRDEVLGGAPATLLPPDDHERLQRLMAKAFSGVNAENVEVTLLAKDGRRLRVALNTASVRDADGEVESVIAIGHDLTRLWELERQVVQADKLATLGQFATAVVHELNNPLTSITAYAEHLRDRLEELELDVEAEKAARILAAVDRILVFTRNLVAYARPSEERSVRLDLEEVTTASLQLCEHVVHDRGIHVETAFARPLPLVRANRGKLQQVLVNLVTNACHAMARGGRLTLTGRAVDGDQVEMRVVDDGHGIPQDVLDRIFEPFFTTKPPGQGTGLGLSIVQDIVARHGGRIAVESAPGRGTAFTLHLPVDGPEVE